MAKAGCWNIFYGYETGVDVMAQNIKKQIEKIEAWIT